MFLYNKKCLARDPRGRKNPPPEDLEKDFFLAGIKGDWGVIRDSSKEPMPDVFTYKKFINVVKIMELKKSTNKLPTNGTMKNARGAAP